MARCLSFVRSQRHAAAWARCVRRARPSDVFCTVHRDAINGVMMGILHRTEPYHVTKEEIEEARLGAGTRKLAFESAIAALNVSTGFGIRPGRRICSPITATWSVFLAMNWRERTELVGIRSGLCHCALGIQAVKL
jgi:hypothetical protein